MSGEISIGVFLLTTFLWFWLRDFYSELNFWEMAFYSIGLFGVMAVSLSVLWEIKSIPARKRRKNLGLIKEIPNSLRMPNRDSVCMGVEYDLEIPIYLPDSVRRSHVHIIGSTGAGKTESVILNFLRQDVERGLGAIILDAKGDADFLSHLGTIVKEENLRVFDLSSPKSMTYDPLATGSFLESGQRLFSSFTWSEEYYKSRAFNALQRIFESTSLVLKRNPNIKEIAEILQSSVTFGEAVSTHAYPMEVAKKDFSELDGLRDQVNILCLGHMKDILSPQGRADISLEAATSGNVLYFRLQSLLSPQLAGIVGKLLINQLNFLAGTAHRNVGGAKNKLIPTYLDEFASFVCPEFADLISKARSAGLALHFSHQSLGNLKTVDEGFLDCIADNSATKIALRVNSPDTAEYFSRSFGTKIYQKITQTIQNAKELDNAEVMGDGTQREAHQFRASPDLLKTLPTGVGSVLVAHGIDLPKGASSVFKIRFPALDRKKEPIISL